MAKNKTLSPEDIANIFNKYLKYLDDFDVIDGIDSKSKPRSFSKFFNDEKDNLESTLAYRTPLDKLTLNPNIFKEYLEKLLGTIASYKDAPRKDKLEIRRTISNLAFPIIEEASANNINLGLTDKQAEALLTIIFPSDRHSKRENHTKIKKTHKKTNWVLKKIVAPTLITAATLAAAMAIIAFMPLSATALPGLITDSLATTVGSFALLGGVVGIVATPTIILTKNALTKAYYNRRYGKKAKNIKLASDLDISNIKDKEVVNEKLQSLPIMKLWNKIKSTEENIRETEKKHPIVHKLLNYFKVKTNRNRIHALSQTIDFFDDNLKNGENGNLKLINEMLKSNRNSLISSPRRYGDLVARYNLPRDEKGKREGFNDQRIFVPVFKKMIQNHYKNTLTKDNLNKTNNKRNIKKNDDEPIVTNNTKNENKTPEQLLIGLSPKAEERINKIKKAQEYQQNLIESLRQSSSTNSNETSSINVDEESKTPSTGTNTEENTNQPTLNKDTQNAEQDSQAKVEDEAKTKKEKFIERSRSLLESIDTYVRYVETNFSSYNTAKTEKSKTSNYKKITNNLGKLTSKNDSLAKAINTILTMIKNKKYSEYKVELNDFKKELENKWNYTHTKIESFSSRVSEMPTLDSKKVVVEVPEGINVQIREV